MRTAWVLLGVSAVAVASEPLVGPALTEKELGQLDAGQVVVRRTEPTGNEGIGAESLGVIEAPLSEVWPVLRDCGQFSQFMPRIKTSSSTPVDGGTVCHVELRLPFPLTNLWSDTYATVRELPEGGYQRSWTMLRGTYYRNDGSWRVEPWGDGSRTLVVYAIDSNPKLLVPDALLRSAQTGSLPEVFTAIRQRVVSVRDGGVAP